VPKLPRKNLGAWARFGGLCPPGTNVETPLGICSTHHFVPQESRVLSHVMSMSVCQSVCFYARITRKPHDQTSPIFFFCMLPMAVARSSSDGVAIRYVLPVWQMIFINGLSLHNFVSRIGYTKLILNFVTRFQLRFAALVIWNTTKFVLYWKFVICSSV